MHEILSIYLPLLLVMLCVFCIAGSMIVDSWQEGELRTDIQWLKQYLRLKTRAAKTWLHEN